MSTPTATADLWLVTGGSGFIALHCIAQLLTAGHRVRTTIRSEKKKDQVISSLKNAEPPVNGNDIEFVIAHLDSDDGWNQAMVNVTYVLHLASPFPASQPKNAEEVIRPAVDGTLRVLKAAKASGTVKRIVLTSSNAAVNYGVTVPTDGTIRTFTEDDWTDLTNPSVPPYMRSKTLAEKAAWDFIKQNTGEGGGGMELSSIIPVGTFGPPLHQPTESTTCLIIKQMLDGSYPAVPDVNFAVVDVRDVASLHILVATHPKAGGQRFIAANEMSSLQKIGQTLRDNLGVQGKKAPTKKLPNLLVRFMSLFIADLSTIRADLGRVYEISNKRALELGWKPRPNDEAILSCARGLLDWEEKQKQKSK